ncbi:Two-component system histidine kinase ChrS [Corynebacterium pseudotuberculosis]|nr:Two-component system histidine kinase ChrS [Corynebacterium pseudotuberculosis]
MHPRIRFKGMRPHVIQILTLLRVSLHLMFAALLGFGIIRFTLSPDSESPWKLCITTLAPSLGAFYMFGTAWENRFARGDNIKDPMPLSGWWMLVITLMWAILMGASGSFTWLMFPLVLIALNLLPGIRGILSVLLLLGIATIIPWLARPEDWVLGQLLGPIIGACFSVAIYYGYYVLNQDAMHYRQVAAELLAAQRDLAASEHQSGRLEERERLSREIHDTVAQGLSSIVLLSRAAHRHCEHGDLENVQRQLAIIEKQAGESLAEARRFVRDLAAPALGESLPIALQGVIDGVREKQSALGCPLDVHLELVGDMETSLPEPVTRTALRVAQEGLNNVVKHAHANKAVVTLGIWEDEVSIDVVDNGLGFNAARLTTATDQSEGGFGLGGLKKRIATVDGSLVIESDEYGTALVCRIPLTSRREAQ